MASITLAAQFFGNEGRPLTIQPTTVGITGGTYQWAKDGSAVAGQTSQAFNVPSAALTDTGNYTVTVTVGSNSYSASTRVDIIQALPENIQRESGTSITLSIQPIAGVTQYVWVSRTYDGPQRLLSTTTTPTYTTSSPNIIQVRVTKNNVTAFSNDCTFSNPTSITFDNGISNTLNFTVNQTIATNPFRFLETTPDGRLVFIDSSGSNASNATLYFTEPNYVNRTTIDRNIQLTRMPFPSLITTGNWQLTRVNGLFMSQANYNNPYNFMFIDGARSYSADGTYMAVVLQGSIKLGAATAATNKHFVQIYKLSGTTITPVQTIIVGYRNPSNAVWYDGQQTLNNTSNSPLRVAFSGDASKLFIAPGNNTTNNYFAIFVYNKNAGSDTWGTAMTDTNNPSNLSTNYQISTYINNTGVRIFQMHANNDGSRISFQGIGSGTLGYPVGIYYLDSATNTYREDVTLCTNISNEFRAKIRTPTDITSISYVAYFTPDNSKLLLYQLHINGNPTGAGGGGLYAAPSANSTTKYNAGYVYKLILFSYNPTNSTVSLLSFHDGTKYAQIPYSLQFSRDCSYFIDTFNNDSAATKKYVYKFLNYYSQNINTTTALADAAQTTGKAFLNQFTERSAFPAADAINGWIHENKLILFSPTDLNGSYPNFLSIRNISYSIPNKPTIADTSDRIYTQQDERQNGPTGGIPIHTLLNNTTYFGARQNGILLRIKNNRDASGNKVASWRFFVDYQQSAGSNTVSPIEMSSTYGSTGQDLWYIFRNTNGSNPGTSNYSYPYLRLDMDSTRIFNNDNTPNTKITLEYKLWNGLGIDSADTVVKANSSTTRFSSFLVDGSLVTITDVSNSPFSNETGTLQIYIKNVIKAPNPLGRFITPLATLIGTNQYVYTVTTFNRNLNPLQFSLQDLINIFRPTMSFDYPVTNTSPTTYNYPEYKGGLMILPSRNNLLQVSSNNGVSWINLTGNTSPSAMAYFFDPKTAPYLFRFRSLPSGTETGSTFSVYVAPWNGVEATTTNSRIQEFSNPAANSISSGTATPNTKIASAEIELAGTTTPNIGKYVTGDSVGTVTTTGIRFTIVPNTPPAFKDTTKTTFPIKITDGSGIVVNASIFDNDSSFYFTPNDLFYGYVNNGTRTNAISIVPGTSSSSICDVFDPDISGDQQLFGLLIPRNQPENSLFGTWQFIYPGANWTTLQDGTNNAIRFWSYDKNDSRVRLRFVPNTVEVPTTVSLPFYLYDGSDFIPYNSSTTVNSASYDINQGSFPFWFGFSTSGTYTNATKGKITLTVKHRNNAPVLNSATYAPLVSATYRYNSDRSVNFNNNTSFTTYKNNESVNYTTTYTDPARTIFSTTSSVVTTKNAHRVNVADIINSRAVTDPDTNDPKGLVIYGGDFANANVKVHYTNDVVETLTQGTISLTNAIHIPNYIRGTTPYTSYYDISRQSFMVSNNIRGWLNPAGATFTNRLELSGNEIMSITDAVNGRLSATVPYYFVTRYENSPRPILVPNAINGSPVLRFDRSRNAFLTPYIGSTSTSSLNPTLNIFQSSFILVERPGSTDINGFNGIIGDSHAWYYFGYVNHNTIQLSFKNNANDPYITISYSDDSLIHNGSKTQTPRIWTVYLGGSADKPQINLNGRMVAQAAASTKPNVSANQIPRLGGNIWWNNVNRFYSGDLCDLFIFRGDSGGASGFLTLAQVQLVEQYMASTWLNPQIYIQPTANVSLDLSYNFYIWDRTNESDLTTNYGNVSIRGGNTPYSVNGSTFTMKIQKANSRPVLSMNTSTTDNTSILPANSTATKLAFKLSDIDMSIETHDFTLTSIFDDIIKSRYTDEDLAATPPDAKGLAITSVDNTLGTWSVVKSNGTTEVLTGLSTTNAYLIKRDTTGNKLRLTLNSSTNSALNRFHTTTNAGLPGATFFQAIGWDATRAGFNEYSRYNLIDASANNLTDVENPFSIINNGIFEFRTTSRPFITGATTQKLFVYNLDSTKNIIIPMNFINQFNTSQITSGSKRIDIYNIDNLDAAVTLQYQVAGTWTDIVVPLTAPINGNYPIRVKETTALAAVNKTFALKMALYDPGTTLYSPNFASISVQVEEANLPPSIQTNPSAISKPRIADITSSTITYETVFNDIGNGLGAELPPTFDFKTYTSFNSQTNIKPIIWTDQNVSSSLKLNSFGLQLIEDLNGRFYYADDNGDFKDIVVNNQSDRFLLASANTLKYIPTLGNAGKAIVRLYAWDGVQGTIGTAAVADASGNYTQGTFSSSFITLEFPVIPRNNAPSFVTDNKFYAGVIQQTDTNEDVSGVSVKSIIANTIGFDYVELDSANDKGLALVDVSSAGLGTWQASTNGGATWSAAAAVGLHLLADDAEANRVRFVFNTNRPTFPQSYSATPFLRVAAWDKTNSTDKVNPINNGSIAAINVSGGFTAYSSERVRIGAAISHRNHAPTLAAGAATFSIGSVNANSFVDISFQTILNAISGIITDPDEGDVLGIRITDISFNNTPAAGLSMGTWYYTDSVLNGIYTAITSASPADLLPNRSPILRFEADKYVYGTTSLTIAAFDGSLTSANQRTLTLTVNDINYAPSITNTTDISYNVVFDVSNTIIVSTLVNTLSPSDRNVGTSYGIVLSASSFDPTVAIVEYSLNPNATTPVYNTIVNSLIGANSTAIHLPPNAAIRYTPKLNRPVQNSMDIVLWDRSNNTTVVAAAGYAVQVPSSRDEFSSYSANSVKLTFNHIQVNYAPTITNGSAVLETVQTLTTSQIYTVPTLLAQINYADANSDDKRGLVVVGLDICGGIYEYTINGGSSWSPISTAVSLTNGLHLDNTVDYAIRYTSTRNTTDYSTFTVIAWDQTTAATYGSLAAVPSTRGANTAYNVYNSSSAYSSNTYTFRVDQTHVNSRPVLASGTASTTTAVNYSVNDYTWFQFSDFVPINSAFSDPDYSLVRRGGVAQVADKTFGILISAVDISAGSWLISSDKRNTVDITTVSPTSAYIVAPTDYFALRTSKNINTSFILTYKAWDKSARTNNTTVDTTDLANTSYSVNSGSITVPVTHVNTPPTLDSTLTGYQAATILGDGDDNPDPSGVSLVSIIDDLVARGVYGDQDTSLWGYANEPKGLVVIGSTLTTTAGAWSYSIDGGSNWKSLPTSGLHLTYSASNRIRYRPSNNTNGLATLRVIAWDQENAIANETLQAVTVAQRAGTLGQSYSVNESTVNFPTAYLNHPPRFTGSSYTLPIVEFGNINSGKDWDTILTGLGYTDKDAQDPRGVIVDSIVIDAGLTGTFQVLADASWNTLTTGTQFTVPTYSSLRFVPAANITTLFLNATLTVRPYDGLAIGSTTSSIIVPVKKAFFSPSITETLASDLILSFRADNKLSPLGGFTQGVSMTRLLDDMGFTDQNVGEARGIAIQGFNTKGIDGYFEVRLGDAPWTRLSSFPLNNFYLLGEFTGTTPNRIRFNSTNAQNSGFVFIIFYAWDQSDTNPGAGIQSGLFKEFSTRPISFSERNGTYRMNIQRVEEV